MICMISLRSFPLEFWKEMDGDQLWIESEWATLGAPVYWYVFAILRHGVTSLNLLNIQAA